MNLENNNDMNQQEILLCKNVGVEFPKKISAPSLVDWASTKFSWKKDNSKFFWALKDISFTLKNGEILGLIGKNGAGKSTLLRTIAKIIPPDVGQLELKTDCRLLSKGVGLRPQLSGRDNILLGCLYQGHSVAEIRSRMDELIKFCELENHIDRPLIDYSSGMTSRLLFTIATSFDTEFLLLDELLSGGDIGFKSKARRRMKEVISNSKGGVVATHDLTFVKDYCDKALYLTEGTTKIFGDPKEAVDLYLNDQKIDRKYLANSDE